MWPSSTTAAAGSSCANSPTCRRSTSECRICTSWCPDVDGAYRSLKDRGVEFISPATHHQLGEKLDLWAATFRDPDGHDIALAQWRDRTDPPPSDPGSTSARPVSSPAHRVTAAPCAARAAHRSRAVRTDPEHGQRRVQDQAADDRAATCTPAAAGQAQRRRNRPASMTQASANAMIAPMREPGQVPTEHAHRLDGQQEHQRLGGERRRAEAAYGRRRIAQPGRRRRVALVPHRAPTGPSPAHRTSSVRASATVTTEPVISTPTAGQLVRRRRPRPASPRSRWRPAWSARPCTRSSPKISTATRAELVGAHRPGGRVAGAHDHVERPAPAAPAWPTTSLSASTATTADQPAEGELLVQRGRPSPPCRAGCAPRRAGSSAPCRTRSSRPGELTRGEALPDESRRRAGGPGAGAEERLDRGQRHARRSAPGARRAAAGRRRRTRRRGPAGSAAGRPRRARGASTPNSLPSRTRVGADLGAARDERRPAPRAAARRRSRVAPA